MSSSLLGQPRRSTFSPAFGDASPVVSASLLSRPRPSILLPPANAIGAWAWPPAPAAVQTGRGSAGWLSFSTAARSSDPPPRDPARSAQPAEAVLGLSMFNGGRPADDAALLAVFVKACAARHGFSGQQLDGLLKKASDFFFAHVDSNGDIIGHIDNLAQVQRAVLTGNKDMLPANMKLNSGADLAKLRRLAFSALSGAAKVTIGHKPAGLHLLSKEFAPVSHYADSLHVDSIKAARGTKIIGIGGASGVGKTHLCMQVASDLAKDDGIVCSLSLKTLLKSPELARSFAECRVRPSSDSTSASMASDAAATVDASGSARALHARRCKEWTMEALTEVLVMFIGHSLRFYDGSIKRVVLVIDDIDAPNAAYFEGLMSAYDQLAEALQRLFGNDSCDIVLFGAGTGLSKTAATRRQDFASRSSRLLLLELEHTATDGAGAALAIISQSTRLSAEFKALLASHPLLAPLKGNLRMLHAAIDLASSMCCPGGEMLTNPLLADPAAADATAAAILLASKARLSSDSRQ